MDLRRGEINLYVRDLARSARFYAEAFGFRLREEAEGWKKMEAGDCVMVLFKAKSAGPVVPVGEVPCMSQDLHVDDLDDVIRRLRAAGAKVSEIRTWEEGRFALFTDPDGIGWELITP
jgi:predicted enzyme related to lactoylglutathione lyase